MVKVRLRSKSTSRTRLRGVRPNRVGGGESEAGKNRVREFRWEATGTPIMTPPGRAAGTPPVTTFWRKVV